MLPVGLLAAALLLCGASERAMWNPKQSPTGAAKIEGSSIYHQLVYFFLHDYFFFLLFELQT